jgi:hypothetical protein
MSKRAKWKKIGELRKTRRKDMLVGSLVIPELGVKVKVFAFIRTAEQKRNGDADINLLMPSDETEEDIHISDDLFS